MTTDIIYTHGNALNGPERYLAHGCNNKGVMGSGIAKEIRAKFPIAYEYYRFTFHRSGLVMGNIIPYLDQEKNIINCITQNGYGRDGKKYVSYDAIEQCIMHINEMTDGKAVHVAMPKIGAGLGGGNWKIIRTIISETATFQPVVYIYE